MMKDEKEFLIPTDIDPATGEAKAFLLTEEALMDWIDDMFEYEIKEAKGNE
jgi:hypothetical protein